MAAENKSRLITMPTILWDLLDEEAKAERRHGCSKQLEVILEKHFEEQQPGATSGVAVRQQGTKRSKALAS